MTATIALVQDTFREALARKLFWGLFGISTAMVVFFLFVLRVDLVQGAIATVTLFGRESSSDVNRLVSQTYAAIATFLYSFGMILSVFASAGLVPSVLEPGRIELLLSKPVSRTHILLGRFIGNTLVVLLNSSYLVLGVWCILGWKTGIWNLNFLWAIPITVFVFMVLLTVVVLVGVTWESAALATMVSVALMIISPILAQTSMAERLLSSEWSRQTWRGLYYALPKLYDLGRISRELALGKPIDGWMPIWSSTLFASIVLSAGVWIFRKRDF